jgi:hypothetical protein
MPKPADPGRHAAEALLRRARSRYARAVEAPPGPHCMADGDAVRSGRGVHA